MMLPNNPEEPMVHVERHIMEAIYADTKEMKQQIAMLLEALEATKKFLDYSPEMPFELLAEAEELQVIVKQAFALAEANNE